MKNRNLIVLAILLVMVTFTITSMSKSRKRNIQSPKFQEEGLVLNHIDTIFQNDSVFTVLTYKRGKLSNIELKQYLHGSKARAFQLHNLVFYESGKLGYFSSNYRSTKSEQTMLYESQTLRLDSLGKLDSYLIMDDFKGICSNL